MKPILTVKEMRARDEETIARGISGRELMRRAGEAMAEGYPFRGPVAVVCGVGNNAGDGYVLAHCLCLRGISVTLILLENRFSPDGAYYYHQCLEAGIPTLLFEEGMALSGYAEVVDCLLGTGFRGEVSGRMAEAIRTINASGRPVISADINSGLEGDSGEGKTSVRSTLTLAVECCQPGHYLGCAKDVIGETRVLPIGIDIGTPHIFLAEAGDFGEALSPRRQSSHKGSYGYVSVMGGSPEYAGAVKLANLSASALRVGCGVAQLAVPEAIAGAVAPYLLESTLLTIPSDEEGHMKYCPEFLDALLSHRRAIAVGMGWGQGREHAKILWHLLKKGSIPLVIDADGINTLAQMERSLLSETACRVILTPHPMEFSRLSGDSVEEILADPVGKAMAFAKQYGVCLLLKGTTTVVSNGEVSYLVNRGCAGMATAGSGDVLSGVLAGLLGYAAPSALTVACGAYLAGLAGELAEAESNPISMVASNTVAKLPEAVGLVLSAIAAEGRA